MQSTDMATNKYNHEVDYDGRHHSIVAYILWFFGFLGCHRFYLGKPKTGTLYFFTFGLFGVGWIIDIFLIPSMVKETKFEYYPGEVDYSVSWICLSFFGVIGIHRFYMGKLLTGLLFLLTGGLFGFGYIYDLWTLNEQIDDINKVYYYE